MRRLLMLGISVVGLLCGTGSPAGAEPPALPPTVVAGAPGSTQVVTVSYFQQSNLGRINFFIGRLPTPMLRNTADGVELGLTTGVPLRLSEYAGRVRQVSDVSSRMESGQSFIVLRLACDCDVTSARNGNIFSVMLRDRPK